MLLKISLFFIFFRTHRLIASLNSFGNVVTESLISCDGRLVVSVESEKLLIWDLKIHSVINSLNAQNLNQLLFLDYERLIGKQK